MRGLLGIAVLLLLAWAISEDRFRVAWRVVVTGVLLQFALALLFLKFPPATAVFLVLNQAVEALQKATEAGTGFVFGYLGEIWLLSDLADWLRAHGRSRFLLTAPPLRLPGAVGSPANAVATV
jgi:Na+ dependent nucleoside transporter